MEILSTDLPRKCAAQVIFIRVQPVIVQTTRRFEATRQTTTRQWDQAEDTTTLQTIPHRQWTANSNSNKTTTPKRTTSDMFIK